ncbi:MAG TPA: glycosyltransferase family 9 protein [Chryseolinea sp.]|nr:glycosyltransferase family 9 protein [Chryseolinea sp.]
MNIGKRINDARRFVMHGVSKSIGKTNLSAGMIDRSRVKRVLISRPNHRLGNQLLLTPLIQELSNRFPGCTIDLFVKGHAGPIIFQNYVEVDRIMKLERKPFNHFLNYLRGWTQLQTSSYDLVINVVHNSSSGRIATQFARGRLKLFCEEDPALLALYPDAVHMAKYPVYYLRKYLPVDDTHGAVPRVDLKLSAAELRAGATKLHEIVPGVRKSISIFTYATGDKIYGTDWWEKFYVALQAAFPQHNIVEVLPVENVSQLNFKAPSFYSKDIREICGFIANTDVFIGADSGMMHLASASLTPTLGLFAITKSDVYAPYGGGSQAVNTEETTIDQLIQIVRGLISTRT